MDTILVQYNNDIKIYVCKYVRKIVGRYARHLCSFLYFNLTTFPDIFYINNRLNININVSEKLYTSKHWMDECVVFSFKWPITAKSCEITPNSPLYIVALKHRYADSGLAIVTTIMQSLDLHSTFTNSDYHH